MISSIKIQGDVKVKSGDLLVHNHNQVTKEGAAFLLNAFRQATNVVRITHMMFLTDVPDVTDLADVSWDDCKTLIASYGFVSCANDPANTWQAPAVQPSNLTLTIQAKILQSVNMNQSIKAAILVMDGDTSQSGNKPSSPAAYTETESEKVLSVISFDGIGIAGGALNKATWDDFVAEWAISLLI